MSDPISNGMGWLANTIHNVIGTSSNYIKLWVSTSIIKNRIKNSGAQPVLTSDQVTSIITAVSNPNISCRIELADRSYVLPKKEWIQYINDNMWQPYKQIHHLTYNSDYDCDNFANSFFNMVQELQLGLCIGIAHFGYTQNGQYIAHAESCFIPSDDQKLWLLEPQADGIQMGPLPPKSDLFFVYLEGREVLNG